MAETRATAWIPASTRVLAERLDLADPLRRASGLLTSARADELSRLLDRWRGRRFHALVVGEFKRGKSTLLNALVGEDLLPTGVRPVTAVLTRVRSGPERRAVVLFRDGRDRDISIAEVRDYVDEERNPANRLDVASVDIELPAGPPPDVVLVDVPGLGSVHQHNTETALAALPDADAVVVVASVDPPPGEAELKLLLTVREHAARLDVVLNKIDYLDAEGRGAAEDFTRRVLAQEGFAEAKVWAVSARDGLRARLTGDRLGWRRSGMEALEEGLGRFFSQERTAVFARSIARKAGRLVEQESALLEMQRAAAEQSLDRLRGIVQAFHDRRATADRGAAESVLIFRRRFDEIFAAHSERAAEAWREPRGRLEARLREIVAFQGSEPRQLVLESMRGAVGDAVKCFLQTFVPEQRRRVAREYARLCAEVGREAAESAETVWRQAAELLPFEPPQVEPPSTPPAPVPGAFQLGSPHLLLDALLDTVARLLPKRAGLRRLAAQARDEADGRYGQAVEQSRETFARAYEEHFRTVLAAFGQSARETAMAVESALERAAHRATSLEAGRQAAAVDEARGAELHELLSLLDRVSREGVSREGALAGDGAQP